MISTIFSAAILGIDAARITIEVSVGRGIGYYITGLPDDAIKESMTRIGIAVESCGFKMPRTKIVVNLFPANIKKSGTAFDLPIALAILMASGQVNKLDKLHHYIITGELSLDAYVQPIPGAVIIADFARHQACEGLLLPTKNASEAAAIKGLPIFPIDRLKQAARMLNGETPVQPLTPSVRKEHLKTTHHLDFKDVKGQESLRRALEVAVLFPSVPLSNRY